MVARSRMVSPRASTTADVSQPARQRTRTLPLSETVRRRDWRLSLWAGQWTRTPSAMCSTSSNRAIRSARVTLHRLQEFGADVLRVRRRDGLEQFDPGHGVVDAEKGGDDGLVRRHVAALADVLGLVLVATRAAVCAGNPLVGAVVAGARGLQAERSLEEACALEVQRDAVVVEGRQVKHAAAEVGRSLHLRACVLDVLDDVRKARLLEEVSDVGDQPRPVGDLAGVAAGVALAGR